VVGKGWLRKMKKGMWGDKSIYICYIYICTYIYIYIYINSIYIVVRDKAATEALVTSPTMPRGSTASS